MNGSRAIRSTWARASASKGTPAVQALMGLPSGTSRVGWVSRVMSGWLSTECARAPAPFPTRDRILFAASRAPRAITDDADRRREHPARHALSFAVPEEGRPHWNVQTVARAPAHGEQAFSSSRHPPRLELPGA